MRASPKGLGVKVESITLLFLSYFIKTACKVSYSWGFFPP